MPYVTASDGTQFDFIVWVFSYIIIDEYSCLYPHQTFTDCV